MNKEKMITEPSPGSQESFRKYKPNTTTNTLECLARGSIENNYDYQHTNLLHSSVITIYDKNNNMRTDTIQNLTYDDFGHVMTNDRSGTAADMTYEYDQMHGWLRSIRSSKWFEQNLYRETEGQYPRYNGNISAMSWKTDNGWLRRFDYQYNDMNWLTHADFSYYRITNATPGLPPTLTLIPYVGSDNEDYTSMYYYDKNGNLTGAYRQGYLTNSEDEDNYDTMDDYNVEYYGNQKRSVNGQGYGTPCYYGSSAFIDGMPDGDNEYDYNGNGAMTKDLNKGITNISYDLLGNMQEITMSGNRKIRYAYAADGTRLKTVHRQWKNNAWLRDSTEYFGNLIIKNGIPSMYRFAGGYYAFNNSLLGDCHFYIQDYLGSNRMVVNKNGTVKQTTHFYPYGGIIGGKSTYPEYQSYKNNDKELDRTYGLEWYDVHARQYDPVVPSWHAIDPLAEKYYYISPYAYCANNPVNYLDYNGMNVHPEDSTAFSVILNTIDPSERQYVVINDKGNIDYTTMQSHFSVSGNYNSLMELVGSELTFNVSVQEDYTFIDAEGNLKNSKLSYCKPDYEFVDFSFTSPSGLTTGESGKYGITLLPGQGSSGVNSLDKAAYTFIHPSLSKIGKAEALSHELYGHGILYNRYRDRNLSRHDYRGTNTDHNNMLRALIRRARMETVSYF